MRLIFVPVQCRFHIFLLLLLLSFFLYLTLRMNSLEEKKLAVLTEISENSRTLFAMARSASARAERDDAWKTVCDFAHTVGLTASVFDGA